MPPVPATYHFLGCARIEADLTTPVESADLATISRNYNHATCIGLQQGCLTLSTPGVADWLAACSAWLTRQWSSRTSDSKAATLQWQHRTTLQPPYTAFSQFLTPTQSFSGRNPCCTPHTPTNPPYARCFANLSCFLPFLVFQIFVYEAVLFYWFHPAVTFIYRQYPPIYRFHIGHLQISPTSHCRFWYYQQDRCAHILPKLWSLLLHPKEHLHSSVSLQSADSFMKFRLQIEIPGPHIMRYYPLFFAARQSVFLFYRTSIVSFFSFVNFSLTTHGSRKSWTLRGYFLNVSYVPRMESKIEIIGFRYLEELYRGPDILDQMCIRGLDSGNPLRRCTQLSLLIAVLASAAPIIIIHAGTWPDLPHFGSRTSSERRSSILCTCRNGHYSSMFGLEHSCYTLFNQSTIWHLISILRVPILSHWWFVGTPQWLMFPAFDSQHGTEPSGPMPIGASRPNRPVPS